MSLKHVALLALSAGVAAAQGPDSTRRVAGTTVSGIVRDSLAQKPLAGAVVQLVAMDSPVHMNRAATTDSLGRFVLADVREGRYTIGFFHPMLDSLSLEPPIRELFIEGRRPVRADLAIPSPARLRATICGAGSGPAATAIVVGVVRDARSRAPVAGAAVQAEWMELDFTRSGLVRRIPQLVATTGENGWFALCDVPSPGTLAITASRGADSTDRLEVEMPGRGFLRRDLYVGPVPLAGTETITGTGRPQRHGDARLIGTVVTLQGSLPLGGAEVSIRDGPRSRADERGQWTLTDVPVGTRMLDIRAVGYYPEHRPVDVLPGVAPVHVALSTLRAVLDTVKVRAFRAADRFMSGFEDRRRAGVGRYLTRDDIVRRQPILVSDLFRTGIPGMRLDGSETGAMIQIRGMLEEWCSPSIYLNGRYLGELSADDVDSLVRPNEVLGIEIYARIGMPPQFNQGMVGPICGSVVIWTK